MAGNVRLTNGAVEVEDKETAGKVRLTNGAVEVEDIIVTNYIRMTNASIQIEYKDTINYLRMTNAALMGEWIPPNIIALDVGMINVSGEPITLDVPFHPHNYRNPMTRCLEIGAGGANPLPPDID